MSKRIALFCALIGLAVLIAGPAYAEVQNIKVSGDITALAVYRNNYDLEDSRNYQIFGNTTPAAAPGTSWYTAEDADSYLLSLVRLRVDADLTDNVSACVRLINMREWDGAPDLAGTNSSDIVLDLAYVTLKEMLYSPLTMIIGRQELNYGNGLIVGYGLYQDPDATILHNDLSSMHGYDAIRAILAYDPWTFDLVAAKMEESDDDAMVATGAIQTATLNTVARGGRDSDVDLYGLNVGYLFDNYEGEMEGYLFYKRDEAYRLSIDDPAVNVRQSESDARIFDENHVYTAGLRGSAVPVERLTLSGEIAGQWGHIKDVNAGTAQAAITPLERDRSGLMANAAGTLSFDDRRFKPVLGLEYLFVSGEEDEQEGDFDAWDPMYRGKILGSIRDCLESVYRTWDPADTSGFTNQHTIKSSCSVDLGELVDGLSLDLAYLHYFRNDQQIVFIGSRTHKLQSFLSHPLE